MLAWVTGASSGIGRATALELANQGYVVLATARRSSDLDSLNKEDDRIIPMVLDICDYESCQETIRKMEDKYGPIDLAILNAGHGEEESVTRLDRDVVDRHFNVNVMGTVNSLYAVLAGMLLRKRGHIAIVGSICGYRGISGCFSYGASKAALIHMAETLKLELQPHRIKVQIINPGFVKTPMTEKELSRIPRIISSKQAAKALVDGLRTPNFEITFAPDYFGSTWMTRMAQYLPYSIYFWLIKRFN